MNTTMANSDSASNARLETEENLVRSLPVGFRFRPNDEEIVVHYLIPKVMNSDFGAVAIGQADLNKCEPWDLPKIASVGKKEERYYFNLRDKKYPNGQRTNRATHAGYWKATGKDKEIYIGHRGRRELMGMKKTLVFYIGRAPKGAKTNWIMHEFRIHHQISFTPKNDGWVVSKIFYKNAADSSREIPKMSQSVVEQSSFLPIQGSDDHSFSTDVFINYDNLKSLPPAPVTPQIEFKPELVAPLPDTPANMWGPNISAFFDPNDEDLVSYAQDSSYYYPSFSDLVSLPAPEPEPFTFEQPMLGNNVAGTYAAENSFNGTVNHNNYMNLEMATTSGQEPSELQILPATGRLGSMSDLSGMWDY